MEPPAGLWENWKKWTLRLSGHISGMILNLFYFIVLTPYALAFKRFSDPLGLKTPGPRGWLDKKSDGPDKTGLREQH